MIFHQHKLIFCHIPRTGGSTVSKILNSGETYFIEHKTHADYCAKLTPNILNNYRFFTIVRNPYERLVSLFARDNKNHETEYDLFHDWTRRLLSGIDEKATPQIIYTQGFTNNDVIIRFENLKDDLQEKLGIDLGAEHLHPTKHWDYREYYQDKKIKELVRDYYLDDFVELGYSTNI